MNCLAPSIAHSPSSSLAVVRTLPASEPASGSVRPKEASRLPLQSSRQPLRLLLVAAPEVDRHRPQRGVGGHRDADRGVDPGQLFDRQRVGERVGAAAPVLLRERDPHQPELAHLRDDLVGEALRPIQLLGHRPDLVAGEVPHGVPQQPLLVAQLEVHARAAYCGCARVARRARASANVLTPAGPSPGQPARLQLQGLDLQQLLDRVAAVLAAVAGLLVAAERGQRVEGAAVDLDLAGADAPGDARSRGPGRPTRRRRRGRSRCRWRSAPRRPRPS